MKNEQMKNENEKSWTATRRFAALFKERPQGKNLRHSPRMATKARHAAQI